MGKTETTTLERKMLIKCLMPRNLVTCDKKDMAFFESKNNPTVVVKYEELDERGTLGTQVVQIDVSRKDGSVQVFYIKVRTANRGRVECEVACNDMTKPQCRKKSIFGSWFKREVKAS